MNGYYITPEEFAIAEANGIPNARVVARVRSCGWDKERAITEPLRVTRPRSPWYDTAVANGIKPGTFWKRINVDGWDDERAATEPIVKAAAPRVERRKYPPEIHALREANGIPYQTFMSRVNAGKWDPHRAATEPPQEREQYSRAGSEKSYWRNRGPRKRGDAE